MIIYKATFPNGKCYIGQTKKTLAQRKKKHEQNAFHKNKQGEYTDNYPFYRAMRKYGKDSIIWTILEECTTKEELDEKEKYWIEYYRSYAGFSDSNGYNATLGGDSASRFTCLTEKELEEFGEDFRKGMTVNELQEKYNLGRRVCQDIFNGKKWTEYTKIPLRDYEMYPMTPITHKQVDLIVEKFKESGKVHNISIELGINELTIYNIVQGKTWQKYTGIDREFYTDYICSGKFRGYEIKKVAKLIKEGKNNVEISKITGISKSEISHIRLGHNHSNITGFEKKNKLTKQEKNFRKALTDEQMIEVVKKYKKGKTCTELSREYNVSWSCINNIVKGKSWGWITKEERDK